MRSLLLVFLILPFVIKGQTITTIAGNGNSGVGGDGGSALSAELYQPGQVTVDKQGNLFISDFFNHKIRKVDIPTGIIITYAGTGIAGYSGDGGPALNANFTNPGPIAIDTAGNVFFSSNDNVIRKIDIITNVISTVAGTGVAGFSGDGGAAITATFDHPGYLTFDVLGNLYVADVSNKRIRKIDVTGIITTVAGNGNLGFSGDGGLAINAELNGPHGLVCDENGNLYISDRGNARIRNVEKLTGIITTIAGDGSFIYNGDGVPAISTSVVPEGISLNHQGDLFVAEVTSDRIRRIDNLGIVSTVAGNGIAGFSGDGGLAVLAQLDGPHGISLDTCGNLYIGDNQNRRVRKVDFNPHCWPVSVEETKTTPLNIYPNPAKGELTISGINLQSISIINTLGQIVHWQKVSGDKTGVDMSALHVGIYFVTVTDKQGVKVTKKVVKE